MRPLDILVRVCSHCNQPADTGPFREAACPKARRNQRLTATGSGDPNTGSDNGRAAKGRGELREDSVRSRFGLHRAPRHRRSAVLPARPLGPPSSTDFRLLPMSCVRPPSLADGAIGAPPCRAPNNGAGGPQGSGGCPSSGAGAARVCSTASSPANAARTELAGRSAGRAAPDAADLGRLSGGRAAVNPLAPLGVAIAPWRVAASQPLSVAATQQSGGDVVLHHKRRSFPPRRTQGAHHTTRRES